MKAVNENSSSEDILIQDRKSDQLFSKFDQVGLAISSRHGAGELPEYEAVVCVAHMISFTRYYIHAHKLMLDTEIKDAEGKVLFKFEKKDFTPWQQFWASYGFSMAEPIRKILIQQFADRYVECKKYSESTKN